MRQSNFKGRNLKLPYDIISIWDLLAWWSDSDASQREPGAWKETILVAGVNARPIFRWPNCCKMVSRCFV